MDTDSFIVYIKTDGLYKDIAEDVETRFDTSNYELNRLLSKGTREKLIGLMKDESSRKIMKIFVGLRAEICSYLIDDDSQDKEAKGTKKCAIKRKLKFENCKNCLEATQLDNKMNYLEKNEVTIYSLKKDHKEFIKNNRLILKRQQRFKSEWHNVFTEETNKIDLSSDDDKRMQSLDLIVTYGYGTSKYLVSEKEKTKFNNIIKRYKND